MDSYVTGGAIKCLWKRKGLTQAEMAALLHVSNKAVSKWGREFTILKYTEIETPPHNTF